MEHRMGLHGLWCKMQAGAADAVGGGEGWGALLRSSSSASSGTPALALVTTAQKRWRGCGFLEEEK